MSNSYNRTGEFIKNELQERSKMGRRLGYKSYLIHYRWVIERDGDACILCANAKALELRNIDHCTPAPPGTTWDIDHADSDRWNWDHENLHAVCKEHHRYLTNGLSPGEHLDLMNRASIVNERERKNDKSRSSALMHDFKSKVGYKNASPEMQANIEYQTIWLNNAHSLCRNHPEGYPVRFFINDLAMVSGCARTTSKNYYEVYVLSPTFGIFQETTDSSGNNVVVYRTKPNHNGNGHNGNGKHKLEDTVELEVEK